MTRKHRRENVQCLISDSCIHLRSKTVERLKGSKFAFPGMDESSSAGGHSINGIDWETFIVIALDRGRATVRELQTDAPEMAPVKEVTMGAMNAIVEW